MRHELVRRCGGNGTPVAPYEGVDVDCACRHACSKTSTAGRGILVSSGNCGVLCVYSIEESTADCASTAATQNLVVTSARNCSVVYARLDSTRKSAKNCSIRATVAVVHSAAD